MIVCDGREADDDVVNGSSMEAKGRALVRLSRYEKLVYKEWGQTTTSFKKAMDGATDVLLFGLCGKKEGGTLAYAALAEVPVLPKAVIVASSAAVYDTSFGGGRRGGSSQRTHTRPLLSESDAVDTLFRSGGGKEDHKIMTWRVEHAVNRACPPQRSDSEPGVAVLRYFGVFGGRHNIDFVNRLRCSEKEQPPPMLPQTTTTTSEEEWSATDVLGMKRLGAYGCADFCGASDAAEAAIRTIDAIHSAGLPGATAMNVGVGRAHRPEHVARAVATALSSCGLDAPKVIASPPPRLSSKLSKSCPTGLSAAAGDARAGFAAADVSKLRALVGWVPSARLDLAVAKELAKSLEDPSSSSSDQQSRTIPTHDTNPQPAIDTDSDFYPPTKNRTLAALDLSSCAATNLLQVSVKERSGPGRPAPSRSVETSPSDESRPTGTHRNHRFFQLNQFTAIPLRSYGGDPRPRANLTSIYNPVEAS